MANSSVPLTVIILAVIGIVALALIIFYVLSAKSQVINPGGPCIGVNGELCGLQSPGTTTVNQPANSSVAVTLGEEINNTADAGIDIGDNAYLAAPGNCTIVLISRCNNNLPSQFICVDTPFANQIEAQYKSNNYNPVVCPQFMRAGQVSCGVLNGACVVLDNFTAAQASANSSS